MGLWTTTISQTTKRQLINTPAQGTLGYKTIKQNNHKGITMCQTMMKNTTILSQGQLQQRKKLRLGTWNIRSMLQLGKVQLLGDEMMRLGVDIRVEMGWTRAFHNTGRPHNSILKSTYSGHVRSGSLDS